MGTVEDLKEMQSSIESETKAAFQEEIDLCHLGIGLFFDARTILSGIRFDITKSSDASRILVWRFLVSIPSTTLWCLDALCKGQLGIAGALLRLMLEEVVGLIYYKEFPSKALRRIHEGGDRDPIDVNRKLNDLGYSHSQGLNRLHGELSTHSAHANAPIPIWAGEVLDDGTLSVGNTPRFIPDGFSGMVEIVHNLLFMGILQALDAFPELKVGHDDWWEDFVNFTSEVEKRLPPEGSIGHDDFV